MFRSTYFILLLFSNYIAHASYDLFTAQATRYFQNPIIQGQLVCLKPYFFKHTQPATFQSDDVPQLCNVLPTLRNKIAYLQLGPDATPVHLLPLLSEKTGRTVYIKRDDIYADTTGDRLFGGNKVRKLEFLLADALQHKCSSVLTFGCAGSNHCVATATYAQKCGLNCICMLKPQPLSPVVQRNVTLLHTYNATIHYTLNDTQRDLGAFYTCLQHAQHYGDAPYIIPTGGSCPCGTLGFINAVCELHEQIKYGALPEPDYIYVPVGSGGTYAGLLLGIKLLHMQTKIIGIAIDDGVSDKKIATLCNQTYAYLKQLCPSIPKLHIAPHDVSINYDYIGEGYGIPTRLSNKAQKFMAQHQGIHLDPTYSSKAFGGMLDQVKIHKKEDRLLFWLTFDGHDFAQECEAVDVTAIRPEIMQHYLDN